MNIEDFRDFALSFPGTSEGFPFGETALVFKVMGKMFALAAMDSSPLRVNLKCDPEKALDLRERYDAVIPGYHMSKKHWNTVIFNGEVDDHQLRDWIKESYLLVVNTLPAKLRRALGDENGLID